MVMSMFVNVEYMVWNIYSYKMVVVGEGGGVNSVVK